MSLSQILPESYKDSKTIGALIDNFINLGLSQEKLNDLMGVNKSPEVQQIFTQLSKQTKLHNWQQLYFVVTYASKSYNTDISNFQVIAQDNVWRRLDNQFYLNKYGFIQDSHILSSEYIEIADSISQSNSYLLHEPQITRSVFRCPFIRQPLNSEQQTELVAYIFKQWEKDDKKYLIRSVDWSKINEAETRTILGFNPKNAVYPNKYAYNIVSYYSSTAKEQLPDYLISWIGSDENKINFVSDLGVWAENSVIVNLRKFFIGETTTFEVRNLLQERRFNSDTQALKNTLLWVIAQQKELSKEKHFDVLQKVVELISDISLNVEYDYNLLTTLSSEWNNTAYTTWKNSSSFNAKRILLHDGEMPQTVKISNNNFIFIRFNADNLTYRQSTIYINKNANIQKALEVLADKSDSPILIKDLYQIFGNAQQSGNNNKIDIPDGMDKTKAVDILELTKEFTPEQIKEALANLKQPSQQKTPSKEDIEQIIKASLPAATNSDVQKVGEAILQAGGSGHLTKQQQKEINEEARKIVKQELERRLSEEQVRQKAEGKSFSYQLIGFEEYSNSPVMQINGINYPIVVKSYKKQS